MVYIAYGSNLNVKQMKHRCPTAVRIDCGELSDHELVFQGTNRSAVATVIPAKGGRVPVLAWDIQPQDEVSLDRYEGYPRVYGKQAVTLKLQGEQTYAMLYTMQPAQEYGIPSARYYNTIAEGYKAAGFDLSYLNAAVKSSLVRAEKELDQIFDRHLKSLVSCTSPEKTARWLQFIKFEAPKANHACGSSVVYARDILGALERVWNDAGEDIVQRIYDSGGMHTKEICDLSDRFLDVQTAETTMSL